MDEQQMMELENQLVMKIMKHFKDSHNYSPSEKALEDIFYSPIGEKKLLLSVSFMKVHFESCNGFFTFE